MIKTDNIWAMAGILAILCAAVVCAGIWAPGVVGTLMGIATTVVGALFVQYKSKGSDDSAE